MREQICPVNFEILAINNNSQDNTFDVLQNLAALPGPTLRFVTETNQGIVAARNRAIEESLSSDILVFIDDDEIPLPGLLVAVCNAVFIEGAICVGGKIDIDFSDSIRPQWLKDDLLGFLGAIDYGNQPIWIEDHSKPIWSGNVAYNTHIFRENKKLRFDERYTRKGSGIGGGEDALMFRALLASKTPIRYRPDMVILHDVEPWRLSKSYFLKLHYNSGIKQGLYAWPDYPNSICGVPLFAINQCLRQTFKALAMMLVNHRQKLRQAMNATYALGVINGCFLKWKAISPNKL